MKPSVTVKRTIERWSGSALVHGPRLETGVVLDKQGCGCGSDLAHVKWEGESTWLHEVAADLKVA